MSSGQQGGPRRARGPPPPQQQQQQQQPPVYHQTPGAQYGQVPNRPASAGQYAQPRPMGTPGVPRPYYANYVQPHGFAGQAYYPPPYAAPVNMSVAGGDSQDGGSPSASPGFGPQTAMPGMQAGVPFNYPRGGAYQFPQMYYSSPPHQAAPASGATRAQAPARERNILQISTPDGVELTVEDLTKDIKGREKQKHVPAVAPKSPKAAAVVAGASTAAPSPPTKSRGNPSAGNVMMEAVQQKLAKDAKESGTADTSQKVVEQKKKEAEAKAELDKKRLRAEKEKQKLLLEQEQAERARREEEAKRKAEEAALRKKKLEEEVKRAELEKKRREELEAKAEAEARAKAEAEAEARAKAEAEVKRESENNNSSNNGPASTGEKVVYTLEQLLKFKPVCNERPAALAKINFDIIPVRQSGPGMNRGGQYGNRSGGFGGQGQQGGFHQGGGGNRGGQWGPGRGGPRGPMGNRGPRGPGGFHPGLNANPLKTAENAWKPVQASDQHESTIKKIKGILNKLTLDNFERLSKQLLDVPMCSLKTLRVTMAEIFDKALEQPKFGGLYADLCRAIVDHNSNTTWDFIRIVEKDGAYFWTASNEDTEADSNLMGPHKTEEEAKTMSAKITGFKRILLNKCQEEFEKDAQIQKAEEEVAEMKARVANEKDDKKKMELKMELQDLTYAALKIKRRVLGNIQFIGELYKKKILTEKVMHSCISNILKPRGKEEEIPEEEDLECLCKLLTTIGATLDGSSSQKNNIDQYFKQLSEISKNKSLASRTRFMILDVIELRQNKWQARREELKAKKIKDVHKDAQREELQKARAAQQQRGNTNQRMNNQRGGHNQQRRGWDNNNSQGQRSFMGGIVGGQNTQMAQGYKLGGGNRGSQRGGFTAASRPASGTSSPSATGSAKLSMRPGGQSSFRPGSSGIRGAGLGGAGLAKTASFGNRSSKFGQQQQAPKSPKSPKREKVYMEKTDMDNKIRGMLEEYVAMQMEEELVESYKELLPKCELNALKDGVVRWGCKLIVDKKDAERRFVPQALIVFFKKGYFCKEDFITSICDHITTLGDDIIDNPLALKYYGKLYENLMLASVVDLGDIEPLLVKFREETPHLVPKFVSEILKAVTATPEGIALAKKHMSKLNTSSLIGADEAKVQNFFKDNNLTDLL